MLTQATTRAAGAMLVLIAAGCSRSPAAAPNRYGAQTPTTPPVAIGGGPSTVAVWVATDDVAEARCEREARCGNIGGDHTYVDRSDCLARVAKQVVDELDSTQCPDGINGAALKDCVQETRETDCASTGVGRLCSAANVCRWSSDHI